MATRKLRRKSSIKKRVLRNAKGKTRKIGGAGSNLNPSKQTVKETGEKIGPKGNYFYIKGPNQENKYEPDLSKVIDVVDDDKDDSKYDNDSFENPETDDNSYESQQINDHNHNPKTNPKPKKTTPIKENLRLNQGPMKFNGGKNKKKKTAKKRK